MSPRRPTAAPRSSALPALAAILAAGIAVEGCLSVAHAQTPEQVEGGVRRQSPVAPVDAGVRPLPPAAPVDAGVPPDAPRPSPRGGRASVHPQPAAPVRSLVRVGGAGKVDVIP